MDFILKNTEDKYDFITCGNINIKVNLSDIPDCETCWGWNKVVSQFNTIFICLKVGLMIMSFFMMGLFLSLVMLYKISICVSFDDKIKKIKNIYGEYIQERNFILQNIPKYDIV